MLLDLELTNEIDVPSADVLKELHDDLETADVQLMLARVRPAVRDLLDRSSVTEAIGAENIFGRVLEGVVVHLSTTNVDIQTFLGLSGDTLRILSQAVNEMRSQADCNTFTGTYSQEGGFFITAKPDVMAACGGDSLDNQYFELLNAVVAGWPDGAGGLALETAGGERRMAFVNGGAGAIRLNTHLSATAGEQELAARRQLFAQVAAGKQGG